MLDQVDDFDLVDCFIEELDEFLINNDETDIFTVDSSSSPTCQCICSKINDLIDGNSSTPSIRSHSYSSNHSNKCSQSFKSNSLEWDTSLDCNANLSKKKTSVT